MASIEKRLFKAWKQKRGMRLSAEEVEMLMNRGLQYLGLADSSNHLNAPAPRQSDNSPAPPHPIPRRAPRQ